MCGHCCDFTILLFIQLFFLPSVQISEFKGFDVKLWANGPSMTSNIAKSEKRTSSWMAGYKKHVYCWCEI